MKRLNYNEKEEQFNERIDLLELIFG